MRTIKFRMWDKERKIIEELNSINFKEEWYETKSGCILFTQGILMQWTGLLDKNKKKIFEGDILESRPIKDVKFKVGYGENDDNNSFGFTLISIRNHQIYALEMSVSKMEVIGNVWENKELLKNE